jgi:hypothetical protein
LVNDEGYLALEAPAGAPEMTPEPFEDETKGVKPRFSM